tara:strand:- start:2288 stop:2848 length:561 start_codon:yes stop_codon:yes gene_type:complete
MAYIGNSPFVSGNFSSTTHSGTGSSLGPFAIGQSPGTKNAVLVFIDGVRQVPTIYSVSGSDVTFTAGNAPPLGTDNVQILVSGEELGVNVPADDSIAVAALDTTSAGITGQFLQKSGASTIDWASVSAGSIATEGEYFYNYTEITSDTTFSIAADRNAFLCGPITINDGGGTVTMTLSSTTTLTLI